MKLGRKKQTEEAQTVTATAEAPDKSTQEDHQDTTHPADHTEITHTKKKSLLKRVLSSITRIFSYATPKGIKRAFAERVILAIVFYVIVLVSLGLAVVPTTRYKLASYIIERPYMLTLLDEETNKPVTEATVEIHGINMKTDSKGEVTFEKLPVGNLEAHITKSNYESRTQKFLLPIKGNASATYKLKATGRQVTVLIRDYISKQPVSDVYLTSDGFEARSDATGLVNVVVPVGKTSATGSVSKDGFNKRDITVTVVDSLTVDEKNTFDITPAGKVYMLSNQSGKIDVVKSNFDGSGRETVLAGTGFENNDNTSLFISDDNQHIALKSIRNDKKTPSITYIRASDGTISNADEGDAEFKIFGWQKNKLIYLVKRNVEDQPQRFKLKSYDAATGKITLLDSSTYSTSTCSYYTTCIEETYISYATLLKDGIIYFVRSYKSGENNKYTLKQVQNDGQNKKDIAQYESKYERDSYTYVDDESLYSYDGQKSNFIVSTDWEGGFKLYEVSFNGQPVEVSDESVKSAWRNNRPQARIYSPDGAKSLWSEQRDGKNVLFIGDSTGQNGNEIARLDKFTIVSWATDSYILLSKEGKELFIMSISGGEPVKVTDYLASTNNDWYFGY